MGAWRTVLPVYGDSDMTLAEEIAELKKKRNAVILAHNYQRAEVQDVADYTGDSLELARRATTVDADVIVFCGVYFMAETAAILNPDKTVLIPDPTAGCPMADMITGEQLRALKAKHPGAIAVCYVNSTAEVKAECDLCVTSGNAEKVMATVPRDREVLFVPDRHLGDHIATREGRTYVLWPGYCPTHACLTAKSIADARAAHPGAPVMVHPECPREVRDAADERLSTGGMCRFARETAAQTILVGTEVGILHRLRQENPEKIFIPVSEALVCPNMKKTTLENLAECLREMKPKVTVDPAVAIRARRAIEAMLAIG
jgi:quinolinate synthase